MEKEEEIFELWVKHPFAGKKLKTEDGRKLRILSPGILNTDSGPDFFDARIELDGQLWVGNIEVHIKASDWLKHGHETDKAFGNVVLHVVIDDDVRIRDEHGNVVPVLVLTEKLQKIAKAHQPKRKRGRPRKSREIDAKPPESAKRGRKGLDHYAVMRLDRKAQNLSVELEHLRGDMEALFQRHLFRRFGMRTNSEPFQQLAHRIPGTVIRRQRNQLTDLEALLFGQSGLLPEIPVDAYSADLLYRYVGLKSKYSLEPMHGFAWKFMRMRPSNFPTVRISQLAMLLHSTDNLYSKCAGEADIEVLRQIFTVQASEYWNTHFRFGVTSVAHPKILGEDAIDSILINAVAVLRYFLGVKLGDNVLKEQAIDMLRRLPPENNKQVRESGRTVKNALESQGLLELLTSAGPSNDDTPVCSENEIVYFSVSNSHVGKFYHRQNTIVVRKPCVRRLRLVG